MDYKEIARSIIRQYRAKEDINQEEFAKRAGISKRSVSQIESKKHVKDATLNRALSLIGYELEVTKQVKPIGNPDNIAIKP